MAAVAEVVTMQAQNSGEQSKLIHARLEQWGRWAKDDHVRAWPKLTLLGRLIEQGPSGASQVGRPPTAMPDEVAEVDAAVARLGAIDRRAVKLYYLDEAPVEAMARQMHMRTRQFMNVLKRARWRIGHDLGI